MNDINEMSYENLIAERERLDDAIAARLERVAAEHAALLAASGRTKPARKPRVDKGRPRAPRAVKASGA